MFGPGCCVDEGDPMNGTTTKDTVGADASDTILGVDGSA